MSLKQYVKKRDFRKSPEPKGSDKSRESKSKEPIFVVHKHEASHLHFDFRLQHEGVLLSWAIPKEPVMDPEVKRLAIKVEDHPLEYAKFEGDIPEGEYGAGHVDIWDKGTFKLYNKTIEQGLKKGHVHVILEGKRLKGEFSLVKFDTENKNTWLFFKNIEDEDGVESLVDDAELNELIEKYKPSKGKPPKRVDPMLAKLVKEPFSNKDWLFELKYDGYRMLAQVGDKVKLQSRNGKDYTDKFPSIVKNLGGIKHRLVLDGEIVVQDEKGASDFGLLQQYLNNTKGDPAFFVFDILHVDGYDLRKLPLRARKEFLRVLLTDKGNVLRAKHVERTGIELFELAKEQNLEGVIAKDMDSEYQEGKRSGSWQKIKNDSFREVYVAGFTPPQKGRKHFGALLMAEKKGRGFKFLGKLGTGFNTEQQLHLRTLLKPLITQDPTVSSPPKLKEGVVWTKPKVMVEVSFIDQTSDGKLRHASFEGIVSQEPEAELNNQQDDIDYAFGDKTVEFTNLSKVFWPDQGYTKGDVVEYYAKMSETIVQYLEDRPQSLHRHPNGIQEQGFYQKDLENHPDWVRTRKLHSKSAERDINYLIVNDAPSLLYMAQLGCIEINPWHSRLGSINKPDYMVIDLDPHGIEFGAVIETAKEINKIATKIGVNSYCKTSGMKGLHIYFPLGGEYSYKQSLDFAKLLAGVINDQLPEITSIERSPDKRKHHVYLDVYQNPRGQTIAAPYSLRPFPGAPVSAPLEWSEVNKKLTPTKYHIKNMLQRVGKSKDIWSTVLGKGLDMKAALKKLAEHYPKSVTK